MKEFIFTFSTIILLMVTACTNNRTNNHYVENKENGTTVDTHNAANSLDYYGSYSGTIPSGSGEGIKTKLTLKNNNTYVLQSIYIDKSNQTFEDKGKYTIEGNIITLNSDHSDKQYFRIGEGYILKLDNNKQIITGDLAKSYRLNKEN